MRKAERWEPSLGDFPGTVPHEGRFSVNSEKQQNTEENEALGSSPETNESL